MKLPVAILAGGLATRLRPLTESTPKALIEIAGRPFIDHQLSLLARNGCRRAVVCAGHLGEAVERTVGDGSRFGLEARFSHDGGKLLGTGGALKRALPLLGDEFLVMYGDSYLDCNYGAVENAFLAGGRTGLMTVYRNDGRFDRSNVLFDGGRIVRYDKEDSTGEMRHIDYGLGALKAVALAERPDGSPFDLASVYRSLLAEDQLAGFEVPARFYEIGSPVGLEETRRYLGEKGEDA